MAIMTDATCNEQDFPVVAHDFPVVAQDFPLVAQMGKRCGNPRLNLTPINVGGHRKIRATSHFLRCY